ncbi:MAG: hypothetical protein HEP71_33550 [Roseivirga sp.]|nr:hypothetical protein [Roseivirga sp.]
MDKQIQHSRLETEMTGIRTGRWTANHIYLPQLKAALDQNDFELVKLNLNGDDPETYIKLDQLNKPYYTVGMVQEYRINFNKIKTKPLYHPEVVFHRLNESNVSRLEQLVRDCFKLSPGSFFINPMLKTRQAEYLHLLVAYISGYRNDIRDDHFCHLLQYKGEYVGFIAHRYQGENGFADYAGVKNLTRQPGFYIDLVRFIQNYCIGKGIKWGHASAQLQNTVVHKVYQKEDMVPFRSVINIHINNS